jgi:hypothetical protein
MVFQRSIIAASLLLCGAPVLALPSSSPPPPAAPVPPVPDPACDEPADAPEIVVCGRSEDAQYRLPSPDGFDPRGLIDSVSRERNRLMDVGASGIHSCSTVGPGGWTGCDLRRWRQAHEQRAGISQEQPHAVTFGPVSVGAIKR